MPVRWTRTAHQAFVGRRRELDALEQAWAAARAGARQVVFLGGEPGAGKSRLLAEAATALHAQGAAVLLGTCVPEFGMPYQPLVEPVETVLGLLEGDGSVPARLLDRLAIVAGRGTSQGDEVPAAREHRRVPAADRAERRVADRVDAPVDRVQPAAADAARDRGPVEPEGEQLGRADNAALPGRERRDPPVDVAFVSHGDTKASRTGDSPPRRAG